MSALAPSTILAPAPSADANTVLSISTIIPTVGRPELRRTVQSVLAQDAGVSSEVVIINDSGASLPAEPWLADARVRVISTGGYRTGQTAARNLGASRAHGDFLHFLDDDDWMLPGAFAAFAKAYKAHPEGQWFYGIVERRTRDGEPLDPLPPEPEGNVLADLISGEWFPFQGTLLHRDLFDAVGGFDPAYQVSEDMHLLLRLACAADVHRVRTPVCIYSVGESLSATRRDLCNQYLYQAYDEVLDRAGVLDRAVDSAQTPHLYGKVLRHVLLSMRNAYRDGDALRVIRRGRDAGTVLARGGAKLLHPDFWEAVRSRYAGRLPERIAEAL